MSQSSTKVIVFGAAGAVGRAAAFEAQKRGAQVILAMRDTKKTIPGLTPDIEQNRGFTRIKADLSDPRSIENAVSQSGATFAFTYIVPRAQDGMRATFDAMKNAGISYIILLSSYLLYAYPDAKTAVTGTNAIAALHAKEAEGVERGELCLLRPDTICDYIAPEDIGSVCGAKLIEPHSANDPQILPLCGPELLSQREAWRIVSQELGRDITIKEIDVDEFLTRQHERGLPRDIAQALADYQQQDPAFRYSGKRYKEASTNIARHSGREPTKFPAWIKAHKNELFGA
ncbi:hypothetical protein EDB81DRAFT_664972 [Dactylonectria macrodidyma]|uniref:NAD(P)-binding domain-containing protein n=1 Tax=Dactylonectria macrodidyma TaxID=307937 RepID=A0A9P9DS20_9HYPO|nr:hypothetical protein EDB81DRAFT_664972 [Dactylonectria macrodidyma]